MNHTQHREARDPVEALHSDCKDLPPPAGKRAPSGIVRAAKLVGRSPAVLHNKFCGSMEQYNVTVLEAIAIGQAIHAETGQLGFIEAMAEQFGGAFVPMPTGVAADDDVLAAHLTAVKQLGQLSNELIEARKDGVVDSQEFERINARAQRAIQSILVLLAEVKSTVRDLPQAPGANLTKVK